MSYILDALHKAERQTQKSGLSPLEDLQELDEEEGGSAWKWGLGIGLVVVVGTSVFFWGKMSDTEVKGPTATAQVSPSVGAIPSSAPVSVPSSSAQPELAVVPTLIPTTQVAVVAAPPTPVATMPELSEAVEPTPVAAPVSKVVAPVAPPIATAPTEPKPAPIVQTKPKPAPAAAPVVPEPVSVSKDPVLSWEDEAPMLLSLKYDFRSQIRPIEVNVKVYSSEPSKRFVMLNMRKYREGDVTQEGPVVEQIGPNSILFSYQGEAFQIAHP